MVDLSGGHRATKGLTLDHKRPRLRHFQMGVHCFVLGAKLMFQNGVWQGEME